MPPDGPPEEDAPELEDVDPPPSPVPESSPGAPELPLLACPPPELLEFEPPPEPGPELPPREPDDVPDEPDDEVPPPSLFVPVELPPLSVPLPAPAPQATMAAHDKKRASDEPKSPIRMNVSFSLLAIRCLPVAVSRKRGSTVTFRGHMRNPTSMRQDRARCPRVSPRDERVSRDDVTASVHGRQLRRH